MNLDQARDALADILRAMEPSGESGLEGLLRDVLTEVTGHTFRLAKSGHQGGTDTRTERANTFRIGLESKRYGEETRLPLDQLKAKLVDAAGGDDPLDLWILAATRNVPVTDVDALVSQGATMGVAVEVLDWADTPGAFPSFAVLCATAPQTFHNWFSTNPSVNLALDQIRADPRYEPRRRSLIETFTRPDLGYAAAATALRRWIRDALADSGTARARLDGFNDLGSPSARPVDRPGLLARLDEWWKSASSPIALLGDEGHGKTWAALSWWSRRDAETEGGLPLTLFLPARLVNHDDPEEEIAKVLAKRTKLRTYDFWLRRLRLWLQRPATHPQLLLVLDGVDPTFSGQSWTDFLRPLYDREARGRIAVAITSRPDSWLNLHSLATLNPRPVEVAVPVFDDQELDAFLAAHGLRRSDFAAAMLPLLKVPRLALLAIEWKEVLAESGDITPERLFYEDWRSRLARRGEPLRLTNDEFHAFVRTLGDDLRKSLDTGLTLTRAQIINRLGEDSGYGARDLAATISEVVSGRWFEGETRHRFRLSKTLTPFALGLALASELREASDEGTANATLTEALDPYKGQDMGVAVLRAATTTALLDVRVSAAARIALLRRWLSERNFRGVDFEAFWRLIGADKTTAFAVLERAWLTDRSGGFSEDDVLIKGFANAFEFPEVAETLKARAESWLGWLWGDPDDGLFLGRPRLSTPDADANHKRTQARLALWREGPAKAPGAPALEIRDSGRVSLLARRIVGILSFLPREPFVLALRNWALSRSIMGSPVEYSAVAWLLRWNPEDPDATLSALTKVVDGLSAQTDPISRLAAAWLLKASGTSAAETRATALLGELARDAHDDIPRIARVDEEVRDSLLNPESALEPNTDGPPGAVVDGSALWLHGREPGGPDATLFSNRTRLARAAPGTLANLYRSAAGSASQRDKPGRHGLALALDELFVALGTEERRALKIAFADELSRAAGGPDPSTDEQGFWRGAMLKLDLADASTDRQIALLSEALSVGPIRDDVQPLLRPADAAHLAHVFSKLVRPDASNIVAWLNYVSWVGDRDSVKAWPGLALLLASEDSGVRELALELAVSVDNETALAAHAQSSWSVETATTKDEKGLGSRALVHRHLAEPIADLSSRVSRDALAELVEKNPTDQPALDALAAFIVDELDDAQIAKTRSYPRYWSRMGNAVEALVAARTAWAITLVEPYLSEATELRLAMLDGFPLVDLCRALLKHSPETGEALWRRLNDLQQRTAMRMRDVDLLPARVPNDPALTAIKRTVIRGAETDEALFEVVRSAQAAGFEDALFEVVAPDLQATHAGDKARALTFLAFADKSQVAESLWAVVDRDPPMQGWLGDVCVRARAAYRRNAFARHWLEVYLTIKDDDLALDAYALLRDAVDRRAVGWAPEIFERLRGEASHRRLSYWFLNLRHLNAGLRDVSNARKKTLFFTETVGLLQAPWS